MDLNFAKGTGNGCKARKFFNDHPHLCGVHEFTQGDGTWYILDKTGKRIQDVWEYVAGHWVAKAKPKKRGKLKEVVNGLE